MRTGRCVGGGFLQHHSSRIRYVDKLLEKSAWRRRKLINSDNITQGQASV